MSISFSPCDFTSHDPIAELQEATRADVTLQHLMGVIRSGRWDDPVADGVDKAQFTQFVHVRDELSVNSDSNLVLRGCRIVIPTSLQQGQLSWLTRDTKVW